MACSSCGQKVINQLAKKKASVSAKEALIANQCSYTNEQLQIWADNLKWFKDKALYVKYNYKASLINHYLGIVLTSINIHNKCEYETILAEMESLITFITSIK